MSAQGRSRSKSPEPGRQPVISKMLKCPGLVSNRANAFPLLHVGPVELLPEVSQESTCNEMMQVLIGAAECLWHLVLPKVVLEADVLSAK